MKSPRLDALREFVGRYRAAFAHAWRHRVESAPIERLPHEAEFLPAALSLQETPVSPAPRKAMWALIAFALLALLWSIFGRIDIVATAQGRIVPNDRTKTVQPIETATVRKILVSDGQRVKAGDVLIELDATMAQADKERVQGELGAARLQVSRGRSMLSIIESGRTAVLQRPEGVSDRQYGEAQALLSGQIAEYVSKVQRVGAELSQREAELRSTQELVRKLEQTVPLSQQRAADFRNLLQQNLVARHAYLEREQIRLEQEGDLATQRSRVREIEAAIAEVVSRRRELASEMRRATLDSITDGEARGATLEQELIKTQSRDRLMRLLAPVDGTVQQLAVHTVGGVVTPAQPVMVVVPSENPLEVEAFVENKDIGFVRPGQVAEAKIETFLYTKYGTIPATVSTVSHDAINDEKRGLIYSARVKLSRSTILVDGTEVNLSPGMVVTVEIKTGKRRVIEYFLSPLIQHSRESLRER